MASKEPSLKSHRTPPGALLDTLTIMLQKGLSRIAPEYSTDLGYFYPEVFRVAVKYKVRETDILEDLSRLGALEKEYFDSIILCPRCGSHHVSPKLKCPTCGSERLRKEITLSHVKCGAVNVVERIPGALCKKCGEPLDKNNTVVIGTLYYCQNCGSRFEIPLPSFKCNACGATFDHKEAEYVTIHAYRVNAEQASSLTKQLAIESIELVAQNAGLTAAHQTRASGHSGLEYKVDLSLSDGKKTVLLDVIGHGPDAPSDALLASAKAGDLSPDTYSVIAPKDVADKLKTTARVETYRDADELKEKVGRIIEEKFNRKLRL
ncbi:MAG: hypothetical protein ABWK01_04490 [Infirmifilum sp.]